MTEEKDDVKIEIPEKFKDIVKKIEEMSVLDLAGLVKILEKKFGVSAAAPVAVAVASASAEDTAGKEEKSIFTIELKDSGEKKIEVIKVVRDVMG